MPNTRKEIKVDLSKAAWEQPTPVHNRWHPDIPPVETVKEGEIIRVEMIDWTGGQIENNDCADDIKNVELNQVHFLSGPIAVENAAPGDLLKVELLNMGPIEDWGFTGTFHKDNGGGFLTDHYPEATKAIWDFEGIYCTSRHIPGVKFAGITHPGCIGTAPSKELLDIWNSRENKLCEDEKNFTLSTVCHTRPLACLPEVGGATLGSLGCWKEKANDASWSSIASEAARTVPGRENGGNCDIKNLTRGSVAYFPVFVDGANLSLGDMHFSQGDGEVSFCGAIEMSGFVELRATVIKQGMKMLPVVGPSPLSVNPIFETGPMEPRYSEFLVFEGISVDEKGTQHFLDATVAYKRAVLNAIKYLSNFGYTEEQVYLLLSCCPCEGRIAGIVDVPNACCTLSIPLAIFDRDVRPKAGNDALKCLIQGISIQRNSDVARQTN